MKYNEVIFIVIVLISFTNLYSQSESIDNKIEIVDNNHVIVTIDSLYNNVNEETKYRLSKNTIFSIDSSKIIKTPIFFSSIYIISTSEIAPSILELNKDQNVNTYYYDYNRKSCYPYIEKLNGFSKKNSLSRQQLSKKIEENKSEFSNLVIFFGDKDIFNTVRMFNGYLKKQKLLYALVDIEKNNYLKIKSVLPSYIYYDSIPRKGINLNEIERYYHNFQKLDMYLSYNAPFKEIKDTIFVMNDKIYPIPFSITFNSNTTNSSYSTELILMAEKERFNEAFFYIKDNTSNLVKKEIVRFYDQYYNKAFGKALKEHSLFQFIKFSEDDWRVDTMSYVDYSQLKLKYLKQAYENLKDTNLNRELLLDYLKQLVSVDPTNVTYQADMLNIHGNIEYDRNNIKEALKYYDKSYNLIKTNKKKKAILDLLTKEIITNCNKNSRSALWDNFKIFRDYTEYLDEDFALNYYSAITYYQLAFYKEADKRYKFLQNNYGNADSKEKALISQQDINKKINDLQLLNCNYFSACKTNQTICYDAKDMDSVSNAMSNYLASFKGSFYRSIIDAVKVYYRNGNSIGKLKSNLYDDYQNLLDANAIESLVIYYVKNNKKQKDIIGEINSDIYIKLDHLNSFPVTTNNITPDKNLFFIVDVIEKNKHPLALVVLSYKGISSNNRESSLINFLLNKKNSTKAWLEINAFEQKANEETMSICLGAIIQNEKSLSEKVLSQYWKEFNSKHYDNKVANYLLVYDKTGKLFYKSNFNLEDYSYDNLLWEKSITTPLFFRQKIKNIQNPAVEISDISLPIKLNDTTGVLKIGINQLCN